MARRRREVCAAAGMSRRGWRPRDQRGWPVGWVAGWDSELVEFEDQADRCHEAWYVGRPKASQLGLQFGDFVLKFTLALRVVRRHLPPQALFLSKVAFRSLKVVGSSCLGGARGRPAVSRALPGGGCCGRGAHQVNLYAVDSRPEAAAMDGSEFLVSYFNLR
jgi:hypothetical protein